jgi:ADP-heptose:LPS heptosyltransferase
MTQQRILVIRTGGLGDTVLLWPAIAAMRRRFPRAHIDLLGHRARCELLVVDDGADAALEVEGSGLHHLFDFSGTLPPEVQERFGSYDVVLAFAAPGDYALAENLSECGAREVHAFLSSPPEEERIHVAAYAKRLLAGQGMAADSEDPPLPVTDGERREAQRLLESHGLGERPIVVLAPGSGSAAKNWPAARFAGLLPVLAGLGLTPVLIQGPADQAAVDAVLAHADGEAPAVLRDDSPQVLKGIVSQAALFVGNDSGPMQLSAMVGTPTVAIFGPTDPQLWEPRGPHARMLRAGESCSPCPADVMRACEHRKCLEGVTGDQVLEACRSLVNDG